MAITGTFAEIDGHFIMNTRQKLHGLLLDAPAQTLPHLIIRKKLQNAKQKTRFKCKKLAFQLENHLNEIKCK